MTYHQRMKDGSPPEEEQFKLTGSQKRAMTRRAKELLRRAKEDFLAAVSDARCN